jgi:hypothetical protein
MSKKLPLNGSCSMATPGRRPTAKISGLPTRRGTAAVTTMEEDNSETDSDDESVGQQDEETKDDAEDDAMVNNNKDSNVGDGDARRGAANAPQPDPDRQTDLSQQPTDQHVRQGSDVCSLQFDPMLSSSDEAEMKEYRKSNNPGFAQLPKERAELCKSFFHIRNIHGRWCTVANNFSIPQ